MRYIHWMLLFCFPFALIDSDAGHLYAGTSSTSIRLVNNGVLVESENEIESFGFYIPHFDNHHDPLVKVSSDVENYAHWIDAETIDFGGVELETSVLFVGELEYQPYINVSQDDLFVDVSCFGERVPDDVTFSDAYPYFYQLHAEQSLSSFALATTILENLRRHQTGEFFGTKIRIRKTPIGWAVERDSGTFIASFLCTDHNTYWISSSSADGETLLKTHRETVDSFEPL